MHVHLLEPSVSVLCAQAVLHSVLILTYLCVLSCFSHVQLFVSLWAVAHQGPLSMGSPRQEYWSGLPFPSPGDLSNPGIKLLSPAWRQGGFFTTSATWEAHLHPQVILMT